MMAFDNLPARAYSGSINLANQELGCAVLDDGTRVLTTAAIFKAFNRPRKGKGVADQRVGNMPSFLDANNLKPYIDAVFQGGPGSDGTAEDMEVRYKTKTGRTVLTGYKADILPMVCEVYLRARDAGILTDSQQPLAIVADILIRALAKIGITALIDEATGYQEVRDRDELQRILAAYISKEFLPWTKRFPDEFYVEMFRLKGWQYRGGPKPQIVGKITNEIVYEKLPQGVLEEMRELNPSIEGKRKHKHHQVLTPDTGIPHLDKHLTALTTLMKISDSWEEFDNLMKKALGESYQTTLYQAKD